MSIYFDDGLSILSRVIGREVGKQALIEGIALRDVEGRLAFYVPWQVSSEDTSRVAEHLRRELGNYARSDAVYGGIETVDEDLFKDPTLLTVWSGQSTLQLLDRRLVGADWLRTPADIATPPPRFVFYSLKGGVGRSTALSIAAADLAARGKRVLCIDLDLEAPGLGSILLDEGTTPEFGMLDALVENGFELVDERFLVDMVGPSALADRSGVIDVVPAFGKRSLRSPANVLGKISRAYTEKIKPDAPPATILDQVKDIVDRISDPDKYDVIFIDARAGLHETTAASILGLGAEIFFFGLNEPQTFQGYEALFSHLGQLRLEGGKSPNWLERFTMVQGRSSSLLTNEDFAQKCQNLLHNAGLMQNISPSANIHQAAEGDFGELIWDDDTPDAEVLSELDQPKLQVISIVEDPRFRSFDPINARHLLAERLYEASYKDFIDRIDQVLSATTEATE